MKKFHKIILAVCLAAPVAATLSGCASTTLEQQIAVKEPGSWDFKVKNAAGSTEYIRIYDSPGKVGWSKFEYGQKHPCNQGFNKTIKTLAPGLVEYMNDPAEKSIACPLKIRYVFRTNERGLPYEGWIGVVKESEKKSFLNFEAIVKLHESKGELPEYTLAN